MEGIEGRREGGREGGRRGEGGYVDNLTMQDRLDWLHVASK